MRGDFVEAVYEVVGLIPPGRVLSYGDIAELLETGGPRQVGAAMSRAGGGSPWWRVVRASGQPPRGHLLTAWPHYLEEGTTLRRNGSRAGDQSSGTYSVDMRSARWNPSSEERAVLDGIRARLSQSSAAGDKTSEAGDGLTP